MDDGFSVEARRRDSTLTLRVIGELDVDTGPLLVNELDQWLAVQSLIVDLSACDFVDSTGVRALVMCRAAVPSGGTMRIEGAAPHVVRVLQLVGVDHGGIEVVASTQSPDAGGR